MLNSVRIAAKQVPDMGIYKPNYVSHILLTFLNKYFSYILTESKSFKPNFEKGSKKEHKPVKDPYPDPGKYKIEKIDERNFLGNKQRV